MVGKGRRACRPQSQQGVSELWQLLVRLQPPKALAGLHHAGGRPAQGHRGIAPALHIPGDLADRAVHRLDDVGAGQRAPQVLGQAEPNHTQDFFQPLQDGGRDAGPVLLQAPGQVPDQPLGFGGIVQFPGLPQGPAHRGVQRFGQPFGDVARLVHLTALDRRVLAKGIALDSALAPSMMNSQTPAGSRPRSTRLSSKACTVAAFSVAPSTKPSGCFSPLPSIPTAAPRISSSLTCRPSIWMASRSSADRSEASHSRIFALDRATNLRDTADFEVPSPGTDPTSPPGRRTERRNFRVETLISIWSIAHWLSKSSSCAAAQLGSTSSCLPLQLRTRGRSTPTRPP